MNGNGTKTHCIRGHEFAGDNLRIIAEKNGRTARRHCRACHRERRRLSKIRRKGKTSPAQKTFQERLSEHTDTSNPDGCWLWGGRLDRDGYGRLGQGTLAHRASYAWFHGEIPPGLEVDHLCYERRCVNPAHLEAVTRQVNNTRKWDRRRAS